MIITEALENYLVEHSSPESELLAELNRETHLKALYPNMLSGGWQGKFLEIISCMIRPMNVLEIGTFTGYSAICLAKGIQQGGKLVTIDRNDELTGLAHKYILRSGYDRVIEQKVGEAEEIIPICTEKWDLVFIDADKKAYIDLYHLVKPHVNAGGVILVDNVLWYGKVLEPDTPSSDIDTLAIKAFNDMVLRDSEVEVLVLPIRDGVSVIRKKQLV